MSDLVLYKDPRRKQPFVIEDLGDIEAGDTKIIQGFLYNETDFHIIQINTEIGDRDVKLKGVPKSIDPKTTEMIEIEYKPDKLRTIPLDTFITFYGKKRIPPE